MQKGASVVEYEVLKSNWVLLSRLLDNKYILICSYRSFSKTLESASVMEIGLLFSGISGSSFLYIGVTIALLSLVGYKMYLINSVVETADQCNNKFIYKKCKVWIYFIAPIFQSSGWKIRRSGWFICVQIRCGLFAFKSKPCSLLKILSKGYILFFIVFSFVSVEFQHIGYRLLFRRLIY